jgi:hypothetical protein
MWNTEQTEKEKGRLLHMAKAVKRRGSTPMTGGIEFSATIWRKADGIGEIQKENYSPIRRNCEI